MRSARKQWLGAFGQVLCVTGGGDEEASRAFHTSMAALGVKHWEGETRVRQVIFAEYDSLSNDSWESIRCASLKGGSA